MVQQQYTQTDRDTKQTTNITNKYEEDVEEQQSEEEEERQ